MIYFLGLTITRIWELGAVVWQFMERMVLTGQFIILKMRRFEPSLTRMSMRCMEIMALAVSRTMSRSR